MGLFSSVDNSKTVNDAYVERQLKQPAPWFGSGDEAAEENPLSKLMGLGTLGSWPLEGLPRGMGRFGVNLGPLNVDFSLDPENHTGTASRGDQIKEEGVTGLYNYRTPSDTQFAQCMDSQGLSVWDANGWWRCLFPESIVRRNLPDLQDVESSMILTREKVESDAAHHLGLYFTDYTKYLLWKAQMNKVIEQRRGEELQKQQERVNELGQGTTPTTPEDMMLLRTGDSANGNSQQDKRVVGSSEVLRASTGSNGATEETRERKTYYEDGSVTLCTQKTTTPADGGDPQVETHERVLRQPRDERSLFPFWRKK
ncbi:Mpm1 protein [Maudiozyma humilis]|uniref:Mpm1 protein n=1 Tax=Maudiozyma humilis TaxID=51915 RepID=A0AAV5S0Q4_MAUHU|nr:Mpm1 protein [Kazachstania humilis]